LNDMNLHINIKMLIFITIFLSIHIMINFSLNRFHRLIISLIIFSNHLNHRLIISKHFHFLNHQTHIIKRTIRIELIRKN
jgi:hypothetical protein